MLRSLLTAAPKKGDRTSPFFLCLGISLMHHTHLKKLKIIEDNK